MERNADVVSMASYAPLFVNVADPQWPTNLIGYDGLRSFGSPSYYVQSMFANNTGTVVVPSTTSGDALFAVASRDGNTVYLKVVNPTRATQHARISVAGLDLASRGTAEVLGGVDPNAQNSLADPTRVAPVTVPVDGIGPVFTRTFAPESVTVFRLSVR